MTEERSCPTLAELLAANNVTDEEVEAATGVSKYVIRRIQQKRLKRVRVSDVLKLSRYFKSIFEI